MWVKRAIWGVAAGMAACAAVPAAVGLAAAVEADGTCAEPEPKLDYQRLRIVYRMDIDLSGCSWWDGQPIEMSAALSRADGISPETMAQAGVTCASLTAEPAPAAETPPNDGGHDHSQTATPRAGSGTCSVEVELEHPPVEEADYAGEITFPGPDGERSVNFETACNSIGVMGGCD